MERTCLCIDLKSFYASVECIERGLDPLTTNLVVADPERTEKTICLAVTPAMKALGVSGRPRLFQIPKAIDYIIAPPQMAKYMKISSEIYSIYLKYLSKEDIHVYSIDEIMAEVTDYLVLYGMTAEELAARIMDDIYESTGITATAGIGTNLYLAKVALDIMAKHSPDHIGKLDEESFRAKLWNHRPLTDFWRIGARTQEKLGHLGIFTMGDIAHADERVLYRTFGIDAELMIDHAWGIEPTLISDIKAYRSETNSIQSGQVMGDDVDFEGGKLVVKEMVDQLSMELLEKNLVTDQVSLSIVYSASYNMKPSNGSTRLTVTTSSAVKLIEAACSLYDRIVYPNLLIHRFFVTFHNIVDEAYEQYDLFTDPAEMEREKKLRRAMAEMKERFGKNAVLKGMNLEEGAVAKERNARIGGHRG